MPVSSSDLSNALYHTKVKLRGYNVQVDARQAHGSDGGKVLIMLNPSMSKAEHAKLSKGFEDLSERLDKKWGEVVEDAAQETWGRSYRFEDYRISGIASDEFSKKFKDLLRKLAHGASDAKRISAAHRHASKSRMLPGSSNTR